MADILFVTWDGGGNVPPALGIAHELQSRGHAVRFLGHAAQRDALAEAGMETVRPRHARDFDNRRDYSPLAMMATFGDRGMGRDLLDAVARRPAALVVVDGLQVGAMCAAADAGLHFAVLEHAYDSFYRHSILGGPMGLNLRLRRLRPTQALDQAAARILTTIPALDPVVGLAPNIRQVGPVVDVAPRRSPDRPTVLVSLSTFAFPRMARSFQAVLDATRELDARVVATAGPAIDPSDLRVPEGVHVHRFVPHVELMPEAHVLVGHGGHGTTMQALAHDLPVLVMPMDRLTDQPAVGRSLVRAGAGRMVGKGASAGRIAPVIAELLSDGPHRAAAARLGAETRSLPGARLGADVVEELVRDGAAAPGRPAARP
jgi:UDP:flavonoid glycosyltransferase YjiC (YdhE family)